MTDEEISQLAEELYWLAHDGDLLQSGSEKVAERLREVFGHMREEPASDAPHGLSSNSIVTK